MTIDINYYATFCDGTIIARGVVRDDTGRRFAFVKFAQDINNPPTDEAVIAAARPRLEAKFAAGDWHRPPITATLAELTGPAVEGWEG